MAQHKIIFWLTFLTLQLALVSSAQQSMDWQQLSLTEALIELRQQGLGLLFTSQVVRPEMQVEAAPTATSKRQILDQLLAPHGLAVELSPAGTLVVIKQPLPTTGSLTGQVWERRSRHPLAGVQVLLPSTPFATVSDGDGHFELGELPADEHLLELRRAGFVVEQRQITVVAGQALELAVGLVPAPLALGEIIVTPSTISLLRTDPLPQLALERDEIAALPHLGDDLFRALDLLPGVSGNELTAQFNIRGGRADEVLVILDQLELYEPYHLPDFSNALSLIAPPVIGEMDLILGGFPAQFGDRMGGVLDMRTTEPAADRHGQFGLGIISVLASNSGRFAQQRGSWFTVGRLGSLELLSDFLSEDEQPHFGDGFGKLEYQLVDTQRLGLRVLHGEDSLQFQVTEEGDQEQARTEYTNTYLWLTHQALLGDRLFVDTVLSRGRVQRGRSSSEIEPEDQGFQLRDQRNLEIFGLKQDWSSQTHGDSDGHYRRWGFDLRHLRADYDYFNNRQLEDLFDAIRSEPRVGTTEFHQRLSGEHYSLYFSDRWRWQQLTTEFGLRFDRHTATADSDLSPRLNLVWALGQASTLRAAWGYYFQSQRLYELRVEDGETELLPSERTEQLALGLEHLFSSGITLRLDLYRRDIRDPQPRYENIFDPVSLFPEIEPDRVRFAPQHSRSSGVELFVRGPRGNQFGWWASYAFSRVEDEIDGVDLPRSFDQPHALNASLSYQPGPRWTFNLAFRYHTGWRTTALSGELELDDDGELEDDEEEAEPELVLRFGPLYGERLPDYHRLDLRISRQWSLRNGKITLFFDLQNLYARKNLAGIDVEIDFELQDDGAVRLLPIEETWGGLLPSLGFRWEF